MRLTAYDIALRYAQTDLREIPGEGHHPFIQWCFTLCGFGPDTPDETPWCSAFMQHPFWELRLPRSKSAMARSWLAVGVPVPQDQAEVGFDVVVLKRGLDEQPGPEVIDAPGHVGLFAGWEGPNQVLILGGNQGDHVSIAPFPLGRILGIRRMFTESPF